MWFSLCHAGWNWRWRITHTYAYRHATCLQANFLIYKSSHSGEIKIYYFFNTWQPWLMVPSGNHAKDCIKQAQSNTYCECQCCTSHVLFFQKYCFFYFSKSVPNQYQSQISNPSIWQTTHMTSHDVTLVLPFYAECVFKNNTRMQLPCCQK